MQKKSTCIYTQQLRFFYYEISFFALILVLVFLPWLPLKLDIFLSLTGWAAGLFIRGRYFKIDDHFKKKIKENQEAKSTPPSKE
jgi:hypothetical protein